MALISLDNVSKIYPKGTRPALDDINLDIERGDFVFLVGASGSGKTTLLSLLLREEEATNGEIRVAGNDLRRITNRHRPNGPHRQGRNRRAAAARGGKRRAFRRGRHFH